jgi:hypothetical protein
MRLVQILCLLVGVHFTPVWAATTDWGVVPVGETTTYNFAQYDISSNFKDAYTFSVGASSDASYAVTVYFDTCSRGCGNASLAYAIYNGTGSMVSDSGSATLVSGDYYFGVKGTGMGAGNTVSYSGFMTFSAGGTSSEGIVSAVPEPSDWALMATGSGLLAWGIWRRRLRSLSTELGRAAA